MGPTRCSAEKSLPDLVIKEPTRLAVRPAKTADAPQPPLLDDRSKHIDIATASGKYFFRTHRNARRALEGFAQSALEAR